MNRETIERLANAQGNETNPTEDVIDLAQAVIYILETMEGSAPGAYKQVQTSGPQCLHCGAFTTKARVELHGLCMKCEHERTPFMILLHAHDKVWLDKTFPLRIRLQARQLLWNKVTEVLGESPQEAGRWDIARYDQTFLRHPPETEKP